MKRMKQVLALLLSLALLLGLCGLAEEPVEAAEIAEPIEELIEEAPAEEAEAPVEEELPEEEAPAEEPVEEAPAEGSEEASVEESGKESIELEPVNADDEGFEIEGGVLTGYTGKSNNITIPSGVTSIASKALYYDGNLRSVHIPSSVTYIGDQAFDMCSNLASVYIEDGPLDVGTSVFADCQKMTTVHLGEGLTRIGDSMFDGCRKLSSVDIPNSVTSIGDRAFATCPLTSIEIPGSVKSIGDHAFYWCQTLQSVTFSSEGLEIIDNSAFDNCNVLDNIKLPSTLKTIGDNAFYDCWALSTLDIPDGVTSIGDFAFGECKALTSIKIPGSVKTLGGYVFDYDTNLTTVNIPEGVTTIGKYAFRGFTEQQTIYLPKSLTEFADNTFDDPWRPFNATVYVYKNSAAHKFCKEHDNIKNVKLRDGTEDATVSLPVGSIILSQKESQTIKPKTEGLKKKEKYKFTSSNPTVAAVSATTGKITAKGPGQATITATGKTSKQSASCTVTVLPAPDTMTITGAPESGTLNLGGEPLQLGVTIAPAEAPQEVSWKSSKPKIASVDKATGLVKALKEGKTTITATAKHKNLKGKSVTAKFSLMVVDPKRPTAIKIDPETPKELVMTDGQQVTIPLKYVLEPAETAESEVTWSIPKKAHKSCATVTKDGQLTAKKAGKVQVKVTAKKKSAAGKTLSATFEIAITDPTIPTSVTITEADGTPITQTKQIKKGDKLTLQAICAPETAANAELEWSSSNKKIVKVDKLTGEITAVKTGKAKITAKAKKGGQKATVTIQVVK